ncbi:MAG: hypothetical protein NTX35_22450 [Verrucomicrobia bacterium]|nr:hypothetical protein [Verrucomicrobiota bacterium]
MKKAIKLKDIRPGQLVVTSDSPEAQVRTVESVDGFQVTLTWYEGTSQCIQGVDYSLLGVPTIAQIEYSISNYGRLANLQDVEDVALLIG